MRDSTLWLYAGNLSQRTDILYWIFRSIACLQLRFYPKYCSPSLPLFGGFSSPSFPFVSSSTLSMFGSGSSSAFGAAFSPSVPGSSPLFGSSSNPAMFGSGTTASAFGASSSLSFFGSSTSQSGVAPLGSTATAFGQSAGSPVFGQTQLSFFGQMQPSFFGQSTPQQMQPSLFGQSTPQQASPFSQTPAFGQIQSPIFGGATSSPFSQPQQSTPAFSQIQPSIFGTPQQQLINSSQLTTQMAPVAPVAIPLPDRDIQAIVDAYKDEPGNPKYGFKYLLLSVTDPSMRIKPVGVSDIMWAEAMNKLEVTDSEDRERLWPELVQGFKDLSHRLKLQDEAIAADTQRLQTTQMNVRLLARHFQVDTLTWIQRLRQKEQELQRHLLRVMRIMEALEGKCFCMPLTKGETHLGERLRALAQQLQGPGAELPRRVYTLLSVSQMQAQVGGPLTLLPALAKIDEQSLGDMHEVLRQQTEAISRLVSVLKKDTRNMEILMSEDTEIIDRSVENDFTRSGRNGELATYDGNGLNGYSGRFMQ